MEVFKNYPAEILILLFLIVTFLQSGLDKVTDWKGNLSFIKDHFSNSPLKNMVPLLLATILILEIIASVFMIFGAELSALTLILLLIGQRLAKDYAGAMTLAVYFVTTIFGVYLLSK